MSKLSTTNFMSLIDNDVNILPTKFGKTKRKIKKGLTVKQKSIIKKRISSLEKKLKAERKKLKVSMNKVKAERKKIKASMNKITSEKKKLKFSPKKTKVYRRKTAFGWWDNTQSTYATACTGQQCSDPNKRNPYPYSGNWKPYTPIKSKFSSKKTKKNSYNTPPLMGGKQYGGFPKSINSPYPFVR